jgi:hypothetical protein
MSSPARNSVERGASEKRGSLAEIGAPGSQAHRLVDKANTYPLSFDSEIDPQGERESGGALSEKANALPRLISQPRAPSVYL